MQPSTIPERKMNTPRALHRTLRRGGYLPAIWTFFVAFLISIVILVHYWTRSQIVIEKVMAETGNTILTVLESMLRAGTQASDAARFQFLLHELTGKFDIRYIAVTTQDGVILAHSDELKVGTIHTDGKGRWFVPRGMGDVAPTKSARWLMSADGEEPVFLIYRKLDIRDGQTCAFIGMDTDKFGRVAAHDKRVALVNAGAFLIFGLVVAVCVFVFSRLRLSRRSQKEIEAMMDELALALPDGLLFFDASGTLSNVNRSALHLLRIDEERFTKKNASMVMRHIPKALLDVINILLERKNLNDTEIRLGDAETPLILGVRGGPISNGRNGNAGFLILLRDISNIRRLEDEVRRREKLAAIGNLAAGVAHELRNPLSSIKGYATYFGGLFPEGSTEQDAAKVMVSETERLNRTISELIGLAKPTELVPEPVDLELIIGKVVRLITQDAEKRRVAISLEAAADLPMVLLDSDRIRQVVLNIALNALDAMPDGGELRFILSEADESGFMRLDIADTGVGIDERDLPHIFDPYYTTKGHGTGLGLVMVHKIIEAHDGKVGVQSAPGVGTTFTLLLPLAKSNDGE